MHTWNYSVIYLLPLGNDVDTPTNEGMARGPMDLLHFYIFYFILITLTIGLPATCRHVPPDFM